MLCLLGNVAAAYVALPAVAPAPRLAPPVMQVFEDVLDRPVLWGDDLDYPAPMWGDDFFYSPVVGEWGWSRGGVWDDYEYPYYAWDDGFDHPYMSRYRAWDDDFDAPYYSSWRWGGVSPWDDMHEFDEPYGAWCDFDDCPFGSRYEPWGNYDYDDLPLGHRAWGARWGGSGGWGGSGSGSGGWGGYGGRHSRMWSNSATPSPYYNDARQARWSSFVNSGQ